MSDAAFWLDTDQVLLSG